MVLVTVKGLRRVLWLILFVCLTVNCTNEPKEPGRLVIDTYPPIDGLDETDTTLELYAGDMTLLADDEDGGDGVSARIDYTGDPAPGTYYIKVFSSKDNLGYYVVRALVLDAGEALPAYVYPGVTDEDTGNEPDSALMPVDIDLGAANGRNRKLEPGDEVDWLCLELP